MVGQRSNGDGRPAQAARRRPTVPPPRPPGLSSVLERNIQALTERRKREETDATAQEKIADAITRFTGSMLFVYIHLVIYGFWIVANLGWIPSVPKWDESFVVLAMEASVEAIFLSTFVLISQNRMQAEADKRADLDLQISLLAEHEITKWRLCSQPLPITSGLQPMSMTNSARSRGTSRPKRCSTKSRRRRHSGALLRAVPGSA